MTGDEQQQAGADGFPFGGAGGFNPFGGDGSFWESFGGGGSKGQDRGQGQEFDGFKSIFEEFESILGGGQKRRSQ